MCCVSRLECGLSDTEGKKNSSRKTQACSVLQFFVNDLSATGCTVESKASEEQVSESGCGGLTRLDQKHRLIDAARRLNLKGSEAFQAA